MSTTKVKRPPPEKRLEPWKDRLLRSRDGYPKPSVHNLKLILAMDAALAGLFGYNELASRVELTRAAPWGGMAGKPLSDEDATETAAYIGQPETYGISAKPASITEVIQAIAAQSPFHPVRNYLDTLAWDARERIGTGLVEWLGSAPGEYTARVLCMTLVGAVARTYEPGCKVDTMLVLEGPQGAGKTRVTRELFGAHWYAEAMESPGAKDFFQSIQGQWVVEIGEMESFTKAEIGKIKQAITAQHDLFRASYARFARSYPRRCVFVGTTNENQYLRDPSGGRRFLPIRVSEIDVAHITEARDQLWAEALHLYRQGFDYWTLPEAALDEQEARYQSDSWEEVVARWLKGTAAESAYPSAWSYVPATNGVRSCLMNEVLSCALKIDTAHHDMQAQKRVGNVLHRLGWDRRRETRDGTRAMVWYPLAPF